MADLIMPTGREMDIWVAENVMGFQWWYGFNQWCGNPLVKCRDGSYRTQIEFLDLLRPDIDWGEEYQRRLPTPEELSTLKRNSFSGRCYSTDITAALEAEGRVPEELRSQYIYELRQILDAVTPGNVVWKFRRATPAQICQAIWMTMEARNGK